MKYKKGFSILLVIIAIGLVMILGGFTPKYQQKKSATLPNKPPAPASQKKPAAPSPQKPLSPSKPPAKKTTPSAPPQKTPPPQQTPQAPSKNIYTGFMKMEKGAWADYVQISSGKSTHQKVIYLGEEPVEGTPAHRIEIEGTTDNGQSFIAQVWIAKGSKLDILKAVGEGFGAGPTVYCISPLPRIETLFPDFKSQVPMVETPQKYSPSVANITYGTYTTPTKKTVSVAKFKGNTSESWVSSKTPFGIVEVIDIKTPPKITEYLYDFGLSGGKPQISDEEVKNCQPLPILSF